jgi:hypothetical protein
MQYRHEIKIQINYPDMIAIRQRMKAIARSDPHAPDGSYLIRSLYFDTPENKALCEKRSGINKRHKFRIRCYNNDTSFIKLEKKIKIGNLGTKVYAELSKEEAESIVNGDIEWMSASNDELIRELCYRMRSERLKPKTIVDYTREPFIFDPGNVRVTLDYDIRVGFEPKDFFNARSVTLPSTPGITVMEVKWDNFLPTIIRDAVLIPESRSGSFSKYEACAITYR